MSKPKPYEGKRIPAAPALVAAIDRIIAAGNQQAQRLQLEVDSRIGDLVTMEKDRAKIPAEMLYDVRSKAWVTKPEIGK